MQDIHDIASPVQVGIDPAVIKYALLGFCLILLLIITGLVFRYFIKKRKREKSDLLLLPPPLPPDEAAFKALDLLIDFMEKSPRLFCFKLSGVFKTYLGKKFKINAPEMTTQELVLNLRDLDIEKKAAADARSFLLSLDEIKYAGTVPSMDKMKYDHGFVVNFIKSVSKENKEGKDNKEHNHT